MTSDSPLQLRVLDVVPETAQACTLVLAPLSGELPSYKPGQFLTIRVPTERQGGAARCYSLCTAPGVDEHLAVTVKRTPEGFASNWICDNVRPGDLVESLPPTGTFTPRALTNDLLLVAAGSGITPVMSILGSALHHASARVTLVYANRDPEDVIFRDRLIELQRAHGDRLTVLHWLEQVQGLPGREAMRGVLAPYATREAFVCGPGPFMDLVVAALTDLGADTGRVHVERFTSLTGDPFAARPEVAAADTAAAVVDVELDGHSHSLAWPQEALLLDVLLQAGLDAPYSCREGACSACACYLLEGQVDLVRNSVLDPSDLSEGLVLACQALPRSTKVRISYDA